MRSLTAIALTGLAALTIGCASTVPPLEDRGDLNTALVSGVQDEAIRNAILAQHTLYDYHFVKNAAALNELGQHDLGVLAAHYKEHPGPLNVRQGVVPPEIYDLRVQEVTRLLVEAGVAKDRIKIADRLPGGEGMTSERALTISARQAVARPRAKSPAPK